MLASKSLRVQTRADCVCPPSHLDYHLAQAQSLPCRTAWVVNLHDAVFLQHRAQNQSLLHFVDSSMANFEHLEAVRKASSLGQYNRKAVFQGGTQLSKCIVHGPPR